MTASRSAGDDGQRPGSAVERARSQPAGAADGRGPAPPDRRRASKVAPSACGTTTSVVEPGRRLELRLGAGVAQSPDEVDAAADLALDDRIALRGGRPAGDDEQLGVRRAVRQCRPQRLGHERHDRMEQAQVRVQRLDERPPRGLALTSSASDSSARRALASSRPQSQNSFQIASYRLRVTSPNVKPAMRRVDLRDGRRGARPDPALGRTEVPLVRQPAARRRPAMVAGRRPTTKRVAFHSLFAKLRAFSSLAAPEALVLAGRRAMDDREPKGVGAGLVDDPERIDDVALRLASSSGRAGRG